MRMIRTLDVTKTLEELEGEVWPPPTAETHLILTCHLLRKKRLDKFTVEDLRVMIGQEIGLPYLVPFALNVLEQNPLAEGDYYPGDLLKVVIGIPRRFFKDRPDLFERVRRLIERTSDLPGELREPVRTFLNSAT